MSDRAINENEELAVEGAPSPDTAAPDNVSSDDHVEARWDVSVLPNDAVSIHYTVSPKDAKNAITSVSTSFVLLKKGMVFHNFAGSTTQELIAPRAGQGASGDCGVDTSVFSKFNAGQLAAILAGTVRIGEGDDAETRNFFFQKDFDPDEV